jgi:hypothetical protein
MSGITFDELPQIFIESALNFSRSIMMHELSQRPKVIERFDPSRGVAALLDRVREIAKDQKLGDEFVLLLPDKPFGEAIYMTACGFPQDGLEKYGLMRTSSADNGVGCTYDGTMGSVHIYTWHFKEAILCSRKLLKAAHFGRVRDRDAIFDFELYDSGDPTQSRIRMWLALEFDWEDQAVVEFLFTGNLE